MILKRREINGESGSLDGLPLDGDVVLRFIVGVSNGERVREEGGLSREWVCGCDEKPQ